MSARFCFFIDGLDEYSGDHEELIDLLCDITKTSQNFKICLSSRPWNVFQTAFEAKRYPRFSMEDLTANDIQIYVQNTLAENTLYRHFQEQEQGCDDFVAEIVKKANGVFLWVYLVVKSLLQGLKNEDKLSNLERRLRMIPSDLEEYFSYMLKNVDKVYRQQAAESFRIALDAHEPLTLLTFSFLDEDDPGEILSSQLKTMPPGELASRYQQMMKRINARCKDLLEVKATGKKSSAALSSAMHGLPYHGELIADDFFAYRVDFLHRTVRDFLDSPKIKKQMDRRISKDFDPHSSLCMALLSQIKSIPVQRVHMMDTGPLSDLVDDLAHYARLAGERDCNAVTQTEVLDELSRTISQFEGRFSTEAKIFYPVPTPWRLSGHKNLDRRAEKVDTSFLAFAVRKGLGRYVMETLDERPTRRQLLSLTRSALQPSTIFSKYNVAINTDMIKVLLQRSPDDGEPVDWAPVFADFLVSVALQWEALVPSNRHAQLLVLRAFQESGKVTYLAEPPSNTSPIPVSLVWADMLLMSPETWKDGSLQAVELAADIIEAFLDTSESLGNDSMAVDPNTIHKGSTLWGHFVRNLPVKAPRKVNARLLRTVQIFLDKGADSNFHYTVALSTYVPIRGSGCGQPHQQKNNGVRKILERIYTPLELARIGLYKDDENTEALEQNGQLSRRNTVKAILERPQPSWKSWFFGWNRL